MRELPILFSAPLVRAILAGTKTVTRRPCKSNVVESQDGRPVIPRFSKSATVLKSMLPTREEQDRDLLERCPYGLPGDRLWVRETWGVAHDHHLDVDEPRQVEDARTGMPWAGVVYGADAIGAYASEHLRRWRPSIHMPRWASRLLLEVTNVRVERLHDITEEDAIAEGVPDVGIGNLRVAVEMGMARYNFAATWDAIYGDGAWKRNGFVWRIAFNRIEVK